jgi:hypothetical protein
MEGSEDRLAYPEMKKTEQSQMIEEHYLGLMQDQQETRRGERK